MTGRRVLITGVSTRLGTELARRLERDPSVDYVAGLDVRPPRARLERTDFIDADIRSPVIGKLIPQTEIDTVVHNQIVRQPGGGIAARAMHDINVIGTLQLLAACEQTPTIKAVVVRGSAGIYGAEPAAPQFYTEEMARLYPLRTRFQRDIGEIENYFEAYSRRHPQVACSMLRYQPSIGPGTDSQVTRYLSAGVVPTFLGFDPRLQFTHEHDGLAALLAAIRNPVRGPVNVASEGTIGLTRMVRLAGKTSLPLPGA
ncbi:MAG TPA: NAD-dependent epimerase/dehydratase family protein, partial [Thermoleophilaceae bacterium]